MSARLATLIAHDARLQYRYGIYLAYGFVVCFYAAVLIWGGPWLPDWAPAFIIFTDPAALGFFFLGALMMLEKSERVRAALAVAPLRAAEYYGAKLVTLTGLALAACAIILLFLRTSADPALLLTAVALTSVQYIGIGVPIAVRFRTVNSYLVGSAGFLTPLIAPGFLALFDPMPIWLLPIPAVSQFRLMLVATGAAAASLPELVLMLLVCTAAAAGASWLALHVLRRELGR